MFLFFLLCIKAILHIISLSNSLTCFSPFKHLKFSTMCSMTMAKDVDDSKCSDDGKLLRQPVFVFRSEQGDLMTTTTLMLLLLLLLMLLVFPIFATFSHSSSASGAVTTVCDLTRSPTHLCIRTKLQFPLRLMKNVSRATPPISRGVELRCAAMAHLCVHPVLPFSQPAKSCHQLNFKRLFLHVHKSRQKYLPHQPCVVSNSRFLVAGFACHL